jgi:hypothetical protein
LPSVMPQFKSTEACSKFESNDWNVLVVIKKTDNKKTRKSNFFIKIDKKIEQIHHGIICCTPTPFLKQSQTTNTSTHWDV